MGVWIGFLEHVGRLVHDSAHASELDRARHRLFLLTRFGSFLAAVTLWLLAAAAGHRAQPWEAMAIAWMTVPMLAAVHVGRTGRLGQGEAACVLAWCGLALTTTLGGGTTLLGGAVLLLLAPLEASFGHRRDVVNAAVAAALASAVVLAGAQALGLLAAMGRGPALGDAVAAVPALLYLVVLARGTLALHTRHQHRNAEGEERYRVLSEALGDLMIRYSRVSGVSLASPEAERMFGVPPHDLMGRGFFERVHVADRPAFLKVFADAAESGRTETVRLRFRLAEPFDGAAPAFRWIELRARRFAGAAPEAGAADADVVGLIRDISGQIAYEEAIEAARHDAVRTSQWKDAFLANVSHELRTPLNAIIGFSEMLASREFSPADPEKRREYAAIITTSGQHLLEVVNSLLDVSKLEAGRFEITPEPFDVAGLVASCCEMVGLKADQAGVTLTCRVPPDLDEVVGDKRAYKQILINLLSNALKFTGAGGSVTVSAGQEAQLLVVKVLDTGIGIAARDLNKLGQAFFQAGSGLDRPFEGTGLGLSVVRGLVGLHGGTIQVASSPGRGTQVTLRLPIDCRLAPVVAGGAKIETIPRQDHGLARVVLPAPVKVHHVA